MPARFCSRCGAKLSAEARFCSQCGTPVTGGHPPRSVRQPTGLGSAVLGLFLIAGLAIWTAILSPAPPRSGLGAGAASGSQSASGQLPEGHPQIALPAEVKSFIVDLETKAKQNPDDLAGWLRLAQVDFRAAQLDASYYVAALAAFRHVLDRDPQNLDALRGVANLHYDRSEHKEAIPFYERYLALRPDDASARTDLATMYLYTGDAPRAITIYREVLRQNPSFLQAHYNLAVAYHRQGDTAAALEELRTARGLATEDETRRQVDDMLATLSGSGDRTTAPTPPDGTSRSPFQSAVETALRGHPIMGPRIVRFEWTAPAAGRVVVRDFPIEGMPPAVRDKFTAHLGETLRTAQGAHPTEGPMRVEIADDASGAVMATVTP